MSDGEFGGGGKWIFDKNGWWIKNQEGINAIN